MRTLWTALASLTLATTSLATASLAQVTGQFSLEKSTFAPGEPIVLSFKTTNQSTQPQSVSDADPYTLCSGISIHVSGDPGRNSSCGIKGWGGSCLSGATTLEPGQSQTEHLLVNFEHKLTRPGDYEIEAQKSLSTFARIDDLASPQHSEEVAKTFHIHIEDGATPPPGTFDRYRDQLQSPDERLRREAARTLATFAPPSLEATLLRFPHQPEFKQFAPLALHNLDTPGSLSALAEMLATNQPGTYEHMKAAEYLAQSDDPAWFPILRQVAQDNAGIYEYPRDAAEIGGDNAVPFLLQLMHSADLHSSPGNAVTALGATGSRVAIPILLQILRDPDKDIARTAQFSLVELTHLDTNNDFTRPEDPAATQLRWSTWWRTSGASAHIYKAHECSEYKPLP